MHYSFVSLFLTPGHHFVYVFVSLVLTEHNTLKYVFYLRLRIKVFTIFCETGSWK